MKREPILAAACESAMTELYASAAYEDCPSHVFSPAFEKKIEKLRRHLRGGRYHTLTRAAKVALIAAILIVLLAASAVAAHRYGGFSFVFGDGFVDVIMERQNEPLEGELNCGYIPDGMIETDASTGRGIRRRVYIKENDPEKIIFVYVCNSRAVVSFDTDNHNQKEVTENGVRYTVFEATDAVEWPSIVFWQFPDQPYLYYVEGKLEPEELLRVAFHTRCE